MGAEAARRMFVEATEVRILSHAWDGRMQAPVEKSLAKPVAPFATAVRLRKGARLQRWIDLGEFFGEFVGQLLSVRAAACVLHVVP